MRISHKYKFIYISIPKTGSTSVRQVLDCVSDISIDKFQKSSVKYNLFNYQFDPSFLGENKDSHIKAWEIKEIFEERGWNFDDYKVFYTTRNPWSREVSNFNYHKKYMSDFESKKEFNEEYYDHCKNILDNASYDFNKYIKQKNLLEPCYNFVRGKNGEQIIINDNNFQSDMNTNLQSIFTKFLKCCSLPNIQLPHLYSTKKVKDYTTYYDKDSIEIIAQHYKSDIDTYGYKFGE